MPNFISDEDMAKIDAAQSKPGFVSDDDMAALEAFHQRPGFIDKIKSIPSSLVQTGKTILNIPQEASRVIDNPGQAADVAARGAAGAASWLDIPEGLKLEGEKAIARNLPESLGGISDQSYQDLYGNRDDQDLINQNMVSENKSRAKFPAVDLASRGVGFAAGNNPLSMIAKTGTQSVSRALNQGDSLPSALAEGGQDALIQTGLTYGPQAITKVPSALESASSGLGSAAEKLAENATGATGLQASKFRDGAGRELLDRGIVSFGDNPANIAKKAGAATEAAGTAIETALKDLDKKGVTASLPNVISSLQSKVEELKAVPGNDAVIAKIQSEIDNLTNRVGFDQGPAPIQKTDIPVSQGEAAKRNYADSVNYFSPQADQKGAFHSAGAFRSEVERAAEAADPQIAKTFKTAKDTYGLLAPVEEAAGRRANQLQQHPTGGLGDMLAYGVGKAPGVIAKKALFPRTSSSLAVTSDWLSKKLDGGAQTLGKYAAPLQSAASRGGNALGVTHYLLQSIDPDYQKLMQDDQDGQK